MTHEDFDHIQLICREFHDQYHHIMHVTQLMGIVMLKRVYLRISSTNKCTYTTLLKTVQCADFSFILAIFPWNCVQYYYPIHLTHHIWWVRIKRFYLKIPHIGEHTYMTVLIIVLKMSDWVLNKWQPSLHSFTQILCITIVRTSPSKILTVSKNPQTNMFLPIVGQLRYLEVHYMTKTQQGTQMGLKGRKM